MSLELIAAVTRGAVMITEAIDRCNVRSNEASRINSIDDRLAAIEAMLAEYLAAQTPKKERLKHP